MYGGVLIRISGRGGEGGEVKAVNGEGAVDERATGAGIESDVIKRESVGETEVNDGRTQGCSLFMQPVRPPDARRGSMVGIGWGWGWLGVVSVQLFCE